MPHHIEALSAFKDNYIWVIVHQKSAEAVVVDPGEAQGVNNYLKQKKLRLTAILVTHHHWDHTRGVAELKATHHAPVYGPAHDSIPSCDYPLNDQDEISLTSERLQFNTLCIPGHTRGHIAYYGQGWLFCGDTLFSAGCGRLFEGTPQSLFHSLTRLAKLPAETEIYCGHEYTLNNLKFALTIEPNNEATLKHLSQAEELRRRHEPTLPSTIALERRINPFLRCHLPSVKASVQQHCNCILNNELEVFTALRLLKDNF